MRLDKIKVEITKKTILSTLMVSSECFIRKVLPTDVLIFRAKTGATQKLAGLHIFFIKTTENRKNPAESHNSDLRVQS